MEYVSNVLDNLKRILKLPSDRQLALKLEIHPASLSNSIKRNILPWEKIITYSLNNNLSLDEIFLNNINQSENKDSNTDNIASSKNSTFNENNKLSSIKTLEEDSEIQIPYIFQSEDTELRAYLTDKKIYVLDINEKEIKGTNYWLVKSNNNYYALTISVNLDGKYQLKDDDDSIRSISVEEFKKLEIIGKIHFRFIRDSFI
jgi:hypothetical protein